MSLKKTLKEEILPVRAIFMPKCDLHQALKLAQKSESLEK